MDFTFTPEEEQFRRELRGWHFYLKRAKYLEFALGTPAQHRETVAAGFAR